SNAIKGEGLAWLAPLEEAFPCLVGGIQVFGTSVVILIIFGVIEALQRTRDQLDMPDLRITAHSIVDLFQHDGKPIWVHPVSGRTMPISRFVEALETIHILMEELGNLCKGVCIAFDPIIGGGMVSGNWVPELLAWVIAHSF